MLSEQLLFHISFTLSENFDIFLITISVFFFAHSYMKSDKESRNELENSFTPELTWEVAVTFKEDATLLVNENTMEQHPDWTIIFHSYPKKEITINEYKEYLAYTAYNDKLESSYASSKADRYSAIYGGILLILGTFLSLMQQCENIIVATIVLLIYILLGILIIKIWDHLIQPLTHKKPQPQKPLFLD